MTKTERKVRVHARRHGVQWMMVCWGITLALLVATLASLSSVRECVRYQQEWSERVSEELGVAPPADTCPTME